MTNFFLLKYNNLLKNKTNRENLYGCKTNNDLIENKNEDVKYRKWKIEKIYLEFSGFLLEFQILIGKL